jgi:acyl transferase domain-containing protein
MDFKIAIVGIGLRLPGGCHDTASFWDLVVNKKDARKPIPPERFSRGGFYDAQATESGSANTLSVQKGYFLDDMLDRFDAGFFSMSQAEVERLDPNQRLLLEVVYEALENAGETESRGQNIAVYAGSFGPDWALMQGKDVQDESFYGLLGRDDFLYGNRISYEFGLHGPSMTVKTACSSSLIALHLACEALQRGDCSGAIVCAANLQISPEFTMALDSLGAGQSRGVIV